MRRKDIGLILSNFGKAVRHLIRLLARPARAKSDRSGLVIQPYRGYGSRREVFLTGRVFRQPRADVSKERSGLVRDLAALGRRLLRRGKGGVELKAAYGRAEQRLRTDRDGYFQVHLHLTTPPPVDRLWHRLALQAESPALNIARAAGDFFVPPARARFVVISDIDDTVVYTGVGNKIGMFWRLFLQGAASRVAFPGVAALYRALHDEGRTGSNNPLLYVSRGPWSLYEVLEEFFRLHTIPVGPILFLREWGLPFFRRGKGHKLALIREMVTLYHDLPFVLIGDSGQRDPEIYTQVVKENPDRILAIYIRNISRDPDRHLAIEALAAEVAAIGSSLLLAADSFAMATHAAELGLLGPEALTEVLAERTAAADEPEPQPVRRITGETTRKTVETVDAGQVAEVLKREGDGESPPNVVVESEQRKRAGSPGTKT